MSDELARRGVHAAGSVVPLAHVAAPEVASWPRVRYAVLAGLLFMGLLEVARLTGVLDWAIFRRLTREYERDNPAGYALYVLGGGAVVLLAPPAIAVPSVLMLTLGDPVSGLVSAGGLRPVKGWVPLAAMFGTCLALGALAATVWFPDRLALSAAVAGATAATVADGVKPVVAGYVIDDNLTIAPVAALAMVLVGAAAA
jgi:dolichol kinase